MTAAERLVVASREMHAARENCPHWDYEGESEYRHECCYLVSDLERAYIVARKAASRAVTK